MATKDDNYPVRGLVYRHHSGRYYRVLSVANTVGIKKEGWSPPFVAYEDIETNIEYARPLLEWLSTEYVLVK